MDTIEVTFGSSDIFSGISLMDIQNEERESWACKKGKRLAKSIRASLLKESLCQNSPINL